MNVSEEIKKLIDNNSGTGEIQKVAINSGMKTLRDNCIELVLNGVTSTEQLSKVIYNI